MKKALLYQILAYITYEKILKNLTTKINLKYLLQRGMMNLNYPMDHILYQIFKIILSIFKKHEKSIDNPSIRIYLNKVESRIAFRIKTGYYLEILKPKTMKLLGSIENKITKDKNGESVPHLEITEVVLVHCNFFSDDYQQHSKVLYTFVPNKPFSKLIEISLKNHIFLKTFNSEFQEIEVWFTDQNNQPLEIQDKINLSFII